MSWNLAKKSWGFWRIPNPPSRKHRSGWTPATCARSAPRGWRPSSPCARPCRGGRRTPPRPKEWLKKCIEWWILNSVSNFLANHYNVHKFCRQILHMSMLFSSFWKHPQNSDELSSKLSIKLARYTEKRDGWKIQFWNSKEKLDALLLKCWSLSGAKVYVRM